MAVAEQSNPPQHDKSVGKSVAKHLEFSNTESPQKVSVDSPVSASMMDFSPVSSIASSLTPPASQASSGSVRGCGRPRKPIAKPDYSDFPFGASHAEQVKWFKAKNTEVWRYNKFISEEEEDYRSKERERALKYYYEKKKKGGEKDAESLNDMYLDDLEEEKQDRAKQLSKIRSE